jgi:hypothetical protein
MQKLSGTSARTVETAFTRYKPHRFDMNVAAGLIGLAYGTAQIAPCCPPYRQHVVGLQPPLQRRLTRLKSLGHQG